MLRIVILSVILATALSSKGANWIYGETGETGYGPQDWGKVAKHCSDNNQSPINIETDAVRSGPNLKGLQFTCNRDGRVSGDLVNNGHAPTLVIDKRKGTPTLTGGPLGKNVYKLEQLHFHFGCEDNIGSEHTEDGKSYSAELHLVTYNTKYQNFNTAVDKLDGLAVIGVFLQKEDDDHSSYSLDMLRGALKRIRQPGAKRRVTMNLYYLVSQLRDLSRASFYSYKGSLTTPPCYESVNWIVMKSPIPASEEVLHAMRSLDNREGDPMCDNFRPTQSLNGRTVSKYEG